MDDLEFKIQLNEESPTKGSKLDSYASLNGPEVDTTMAETRSSDAIQISSSNYDLSRAGHPTACVFTLLFKVLAFASYNCLSWIVGTTVTVFIVTIVFSAFDFWVVKNISGRLLVGLRWFSRYQDDGTEVWSFESHDGSRELNRVDAAFFWSSQIICVVYWGLVTLKNAFGFSTWVTLDVVVLSLAFTNFYGFYKCRGQHQKKVASLKSQLTQKGMSFLGNMMFRQQEGS